MVIKVHIASYVRPHECDNDYKYTITKDGYRWKAYLTTKGFLEFIEIYGLKINPKKTRRFEGCGRGIEYACFPRDIEEKHFSSLADLPKGAKPFWYLSDGNYTICYYLKTDSKTTIYKPDPNARDVYTPYGLTEYRYLQNIKTAKGAN